MPQKLDLQDPSDQRSHKTVFHQFLNPLTPAEHTNTVSCIVLLHIYPKIMSLKDGMTRRFKDGVSFTHEAEEQFIKLPT
jgi:hypothetical protein